MKIKDMLIKFGERKAFQSISPRSFPQAAYQPKLPTKIQMIAKK